MLCGAKKQYIIRIHMLQASSYIAAHWPIPSHIHTQVHVHLHILYPYTYTYTYTLDRERDSRAVQYMGEDVSGVDTRQCEQDCGCLLWPLGDSSMSS